MLMRSVVEAQICVKSALRLRCRSAQGESTFIHYKEVKLPFLSIVGGLPGPERQDGRYVPQ